MSLSTILLFSYGTLQYQNVQIANFGRKLTGREDALPGYTRGRVPITEPEVVASHHRKDRYRAHPEPGRPRPALGTRR